MSILLPVSTLTSLIKGEFSCILMRHVTCKAMSFLTSLVGLLEISFLFISLLFLTELLFKIIVFKIWFGNCLCCYQHHTKEIKINIIVYRCHFHCFSKVGGWKKAY